MILSVEFSIKLILPNGILFCPVYLYEYLFMAFNKISQLMVSHRFSIVCGRSDLFLKSDFSLCALPNKYFLNTQKSNNKNISILNI